MLAFSPSSLRHRNNIAFEGRSFVHVAKKKIWNNAKHIISCCQHNLCCCNFNKILCYHCCLFWNICLPYLSFSCKVFLLVVSFEFCKSRFSQRQRGLEVSTFIICHRIYNSSEEVLKLPRESNFSVSIFQPHQTLETWK